MWKLIYFFIIYGQLVRSAPQNFCPSDCKCDTLEENLELQCSSFDLLSKLGPKHYQAVSKLTLKNSLIEKVDPKLKYLRNVQYLDLSNNNVDITTIPSLSKLKTLKLSENNIKNIKLSSLPQNLVELDLSQNYLDQIPNDWRRLKSLKTLHLYKNHFHCDCSNVRVYKEIIENGIAIPNPPTCFSPPEYSGKLISSVNCSLIDEMMNDEPYSGDSEPLEPVTENGVIIDDGSEYFITRQTEEEKEEGSGDVEDSDAVFLPEECLNCSTPKPIGADDEKFASSEPTLGDQINMLYEDIFEFSNKSDEVNTTVLPEQTTEIVTETVFIKKIDTSLNEEIDLDKGHVKLLGTLPPSEELEVTAAPDNKNTVYMIVGVCTVILILALLFLLRKRKGNNRHHSTAEYGEELKPMTELKSSNNYDIPEKKSAVIPENSPLINGTNGTSDDQKYPYDDEMFESESMMIQPREKVTIKEKELPDSIPKTPLLVQRLKNSEGEIVTVLPPP